MRMIIIFIDGLGLGCEKKSKNPLFAANTPNIDYIFYRYKVIPTDASLGVDGLPQSATGQTAIFTGVNAAKILGKHISGQPTYTLKKIIMNNNLFKQLINMGLTVTNTNVYRQEYLNRMMDNKDRMNRPSVTSIMNISAGLEFRTVEHYIKGKGIYHDISGQLLIDYGYKVNRLSPKEAAERLCEISREYDVSLFEHFMTDIIGHMMDMDRSIMQLEMLDDFLGELIRLVDLRNDVILLTSDHGNIEDVTVKTHTMNKVPTVILGEAPCHIPLRIASLLDITPAIIQMFKSRR